MPLTRVPTLRTLTPSPDHPWPRPCTIKSQHVHMQSSHWYLHRTCPYMKSDFRNELRVCDLVPPGRECERFDGICRGSRDRVFLGHLCTIRPDNRRFSMTQQGTRTRKVSHLSACTLPLWCTHLASRCPLVLEARRHLLRTHQHMQKQGSNTIGTVRASVHTYPVCVVCWCPSLMCCVGVLGACECVRAGVGSGAPGAGQKIRTKQSSSR